MNKEKDELKDEFISLNLSRNNGFERNESDSNYADIFFSGERLCVKKLKKNKKDKKCRIENEKDIYEFLSKYLETNKYIKKNILKYYYGGEDFLLLKYETKGSLMNYILNKGLDEIIVKIIFNKILLCINAIHEVGVCHLDLKPNNILLNENYEIKIFDFGYSVSEPKFILEKLDFNVGCSLFKSPEMFNRIPYNGMKSDIFSLGITLYYLIKGLFTPNGFKSKDKGDYNKYKQYLNIILEDAKKNFSKDCYYVISQMTKENGEERPSIQKILEYDWFNEIKDLKDEERNKNVFDYFKQIKLTDEIQTETKEASISSIQYKSIFEQQEPRIIDKKLLNLLLNILKIKGKLNKTLFMNLLIHELNSEIKEKKEITPNKKILEFDIIIKDYNFEEEKDDDIIIRITLLKIKDDKDNCCYMNTVLLSGSLYHYYFTYKKIIYDLAKKVAKMTGSTQSKLE